MGAGVADRGLEPTTGARLQSPLDTFACTLHGDDCTTKSENSSSIQKCLRNQGAAAGFSSGRREKYVSGCKADV